MRAMRIEATVDHQSTWAMIEARKNEANKVEAEKRDQEAINSALKKVPVRFFGKIFNDYYITCDAQAEVKKIIEIYAATYVERFLEGASLIFLGSPGTGKTFLAFILYQFLVKKGLRVEYQPSLNFLRLLQDKQFESYQALDSCLSFYKALPFLIIDEVTEGCGKGSYPADWERNLLRMLIDIRYQENRPSLIITNRNKEELLARLGEPTIDRLSEKGISLAFNWDSYRKK